MVAQRSAAIASMQIAAARLKERVARPRRLGETTHTPYGEAGRLLGIREATITTRLYRARQRIADSLTGMDRLAAVSRRPMK